MYAKHAKTPCFCVLRFEIVYRVYLPDKSCSCNFFNAATCLVLMNSRTVTVVRTSLTPAPWMCAAICAEVRTPLMGSLIVGLLKISEVCNKFRVSDDTVRRWFTSGVKRFGQQHTLPAIKVGGTWRIEEADLSNFLDNLQATKSCRQPQTRASLAARERAALAALLQSKGRSSRARRHTSSAKTQSATQ